MLEHPWFTTGAEVLRRKGLNPPYRPPSFRARPLEAAQANFDLADDVPGAQETAQDLLPFEGDQRMFLGFDGSCGEEGDIDD